MKTVLILLAIAAAVIFFMLIIPIFAKSQEILGIETAGTCKDFAVTITAKDLGAACWDVKLDVPGRVYNEREDKWKSSFFYNEKALCYPDTAAVIVIKLETSEPVIEATAKLRQNSKIIEHDFTISQSCPQPLPDYWTLLVAIIIILIFGWPLAWWWKRK